MFCKKCNSELLENVQFCSKCGNAVEAETEIIVNSTERKRHGFTSFWLILSLIIYVISFGNSLVSYGTVQMVGISSGMAMFGWLTSITAIIGIILVLRWKKIGFWLFVVSNIFSLLLFITAMGNVSSTITEDISAEMIVKFFNSLSIITVLINLVITWGVLHIRKNGKNTWEQLVPISKSGWF
jgi:hypothetical protein